MKKLSTTIKRLVPRGEDAKFIGSEPEWLTQPTDETRVGTLAKAFNWYNYSYSRKDAKDLIIQYFEVNKKAKELKLMRGIPDSRVKTTTGWICRMSVMGLQLKDYEQSILDEHLAELLAGKQEEQKVAATSEETAQQKLTIQDHLREKASECAAELDGMYDDFIDADAKMSANFKPIALIRGMNIATQMIPHITAVWKLRLAELEEVVEGKDPQLVEGYSHLTKTQLKSCVKFCETVLADCQSYISIKKVERKPRAKKAVSPEKVALKFKYLKEFAELELKSLPATSLVGASEAFIYDTAKRKLIYVVADAHAGTFTIKGSSLIAFDALTTVQKTLRKPAEQIKAIMSVGKPAARKAFKEIKSTEIKYTGRSNDNLVILKCW
jgi:hypothetical protein